MMDKRYDVRRTLDVPYAIGGVDYEPGRGAGRYRPLLLDIYEPVDAPGLRPALILAFGGAFHRGSKGAEVFEGEHPCTAMAEYCAEFARRGFVCFSIDYRLMQEAPDPGVTPFLLPEQPQNRDRIDFVRGILGLPPSTPEMMANTLEAATDDMSAAAMFVRSQAQRFRVDIERIAIGGFSAGAAAALNAAYAENAPVAAVVALSGRIAGQTLQAYLGACNPAPAVLVIHADDDLPLIRDGVGEMQGLFAAAGVPNNFVRVPGATHFYLRTAEAVLPDGRRTDVESAIAQFLEERLTIGEKGAAAA